MTRNELTVCKKVFDLLLGMLWAYKETESKLQTKGLTVIITDEILHRIEVACEGNGILEDHPAQWIAPKRAAMEKLDNNIWTQWILESGFIE